MLVPWVGGGSAYQAYQKLFLNKSSIVTGNNEPGMTVYPGALLGVRVCSGCSRGMRPPCIIPRNVKCLAYVKEDPERGGMSPSMMYFK